MNKRVNITYSVELEAIPKHVGDLINKTYNFLYLSLNEKFNNSLNMLKKDNEKEALKAIEEIRQDMFKIDCCLSDCFNILKDYQLTSLNSIKDEEKNNDKAG